MAVVSAAPGGIKMSPGYTRTKMELSKFMGLLSDKLREQRDLSESSAKQYLQTLYKLNGSNSFSSLAWTKNVEAVQAVVDTYALSTRGTQYNILVAALSTVKSGYTKAIAYWQGKAMESRTERNALPKHQKSEKQESNWVSMEEVLALKTALETAVAGFAKKKTLTKAQFETLQRLMVLSLYTDIPPRRNMDYLLMHIAKVLPADADTTKNYFDVANSRFVFNRYKTAKVYQQQVVSVPESLQKVLALYLKFHPGNSKDVNEVPLLVKASGAPMTAKNGITTILNKVFGKAVGSSMLRHIFLSEKYGDDLKELTAARTADADSMAHSLATATEYIKY